MHGGPTTAPQEGSLPGDAQSPHLRARSLLSLKTPRPTYKHKHVHGHLACPGCRGRRQTPRSKQSNRRIKATDTGRCWVQPYDLPAPRGRRHLQTARSRSEIKEEGGFLTHVTLTPAPGDVPRKQDPNLSQADTRPATRENDHLWLPGGVGPRKERLASLFENRPRRLTMQTGNRRTTVRSLSRGLVKAVDQTQRPSVTKLQASSGRTKAPQISDCVNSGAHAILHGETHGRASVSSRSRHVVPGS